jgi:hypothetical protein
MSKLQTKTIAAIAVTLLSLPLMSGAHAKEAKAIPAARKAIYNITRTPSAMTLKAPVGLNETDFALPFPPGFQNSTGG